MDHPSRVGDGTQCLGGAKARFVLSVVLAKAIAHSVNPPLDLDPYGGTDPLGMFPLFLKRTADVIAPLLV